MNIFSQILKKIFPRMKKQSKTSLSYKLSLINAFFASVAPIGCRIHLPHLLPPQLLLRTPPHHHPHWESARSAFALLGAWSSRFLLLPVLQSQAYTFQDTALRLAFP